jgi:hypothetical protein
MSRTTRIAVDCQKGIGAVMLMVRSRVEVPTE